MHKAALLAALLSGLAIPAAAQTRHEWQWQWLGTFASARFVGGGVGYAIRARGRTRIGLTVNGGDLDGELGGRAEVVASYHLNPFRRHGVVPYAGGGMAVAATRNEAFQYAVLLLGVEWAPGGRRGWFAEVGIAGGVRLSAGYRLRWLAPGR